ncbi:MAG: ECF transporter S component [Eubacteriales bacterium]|nr:ECF transporter S component [Eubacteriales bacterium]
METINKRNTNTRNLARAGILCALIIVMTFVPYTGYIYYGLIEITTLHIVVAVGAVLLGWQYGAVLGLVWGITCVLRALTNPLWAPFINPLISVVPRVFVGAVGGLVAQGLRKLKVRSGLVAGISAAAATLTNTVLVLSALKLFSTVLTGMPLFGTIYATLIGLNGSIELIAAILLVPVIVAAIKPHELVLGIDIGASTTKFVLVKNGKCVREYRKPDEQSFEDALDSFGYAGVRRIALTGVGASYIKGNLRGIPTVRKDEFASVARGASKLSKKFNMLIVSVGTGTSFTRMTPIRAWHVGGTGLGGGLLKGLSGRLCKTNDMDELQKLAANGDLHEIDLQLMDVCEGTISYLKPNTTVANMSKLNEQTACADLAAGLCNMIFQAIGVMAVFAAKRRFTRTIVLVGTISDWPIAQRSLSEVAALHRVKFIVPDHAAFATAIGAALLE